MKLRLLPVLFLFAFIICKQALGQPVNAYAKVTAINGKVLTTSVRNQANYTFTVNDDVILMQMQGKVISDSTSTSSNFGNTTASLGATGQFEVFKILAVTASTITLSYNPTLPYTINGSSSVQLISFQAQTNNYTSSANITGLPWDGSIGGVIAINVPNQFTLAHNISMDASGFRGGAVSIQGAGDGGGCTSGTYSGAIGPTFAGKGEGIFRISGIAMQGARGKTATGAGGGNLHNAGGGGGGNNTAGGAGGIGYNCAGNPGGGVGGLGLGTNISSSRVTMGGGGGGGQQNNSSATAGANGGGIILIKAASMRTNGNCGARLITSNGGTAGNTNTANGGNDGAGGGGAGGTILFEVTTWNIGNNCDLNVQASGGAGGSVQAPDAHGGGGGGGTGKIIYSSTPPANVTSTTTTGAGGCSDNSCSQAGATGTTPNVTTSPGTSTGGGAGPLPVSLIYFTGTHNKETDRFDLRWATATETNNKYFSIYRSFDAQNFEKIGEIDGSGNATLQRNYNFTDSTGFEKSYYYQLHQMDFDGTTRMVSIIHITRNGEGSPDIFVYPNPINKSDKLTIDMIRPGRGINTLALYDVQGREMKRMTIDIKDAFHTLDLETTDLPSGVYVLTVTSGTTGFRRKIIIR